MKADVPVANIVCTLPRSDRGFRPCRRGLDERLRARLHASALRPRPPARDDPDRCVCLPARRPRALARAVTFVSVMALGGFLGVMGVPVPFVEVGIALSVIVLGAIVAFGVKAPLAVAMAAVGFFAIFHGHAHGSEMPLDASGFEYGLGFMLATAALHAVGIGIGFLIGMSSKTLGNNVYRVAGGLASIAGIGLLLGYI